MNKRYKFSQKEKDLYAVAKTLGNDPEVYAKYICDGLKDGDMSPSLRSLYEEAVYGSNEDVKRRIISRVYSIGHVSRYAH